MKTPSALTIVAFLAFAIEEIAAQDYKEQLKGLPVCAQSCITSGFAKCKCKNLEFTCTCTCRTFRPFSEECANIACGGQLLKPLLDSLDSTCKSSNAELSSRSSNTVSISTTSNRLSASSQTVSAPASGSTVVSIRIDTTIPPIDKPEASGPFMPYGGTISIGAGITGTIGRTIASPLRTGITGSGARSTNSPLLVDETKGLGYTASNSVSIPTSGPLIIDESRGAGYTMTTSGLYDYSATTSRERYTYCSQGLSSNETMANGTANAWNGNATCTYYMMEDFQGAAAAKQLGGHMWFSLGTLFLLSWMCV